MACARNVSSVGQLSEVGRAVELTAQSDDGHLVRASITPDGGPNSLDAPKLLGLTIFDGDDADAIVADDPNVDGDALASSVVDVTALNAEYRAPSSEGREALYTDAEYRAQLRLQLTLKRQPPPGGGFCLLPGRNDPANDYARADATGECNMGCCVFDVGLEASDRAPRCRCASPLVRGAYCDIEIECASLGTVENECFTMEVADDTHGNTSLASCRCRQLGRVAIFLKRVLPRTALGEHFHLAAAISALHDAPYVVPTLATLLALLLSGAALARHIDRIAPVYFSETPRWLQVPAGEWTVWRVLLLHARKDTTVARIFYNSTGCVSYSRLQLVVLLSCKLLTLTLVPLLFKGTRQCSEDAEIGVSLISVLISSVSTLCLRRLLKRGLPKRHKRLLKSHRAALKAELAKAHYWRLGRTASPRLLLHRVHRSAAGAAGACASENAPGSGCSTSSAVEPTGPAGSAEGWSSAYVTLPNNSRDGAAPEGAATEEGRDEATAADTVTEVTCGQSTCTGPDVLTSNDTAGMDSPTVVAINDQADESPAASIGNGAAGRRWWSFLAAPSCHRAPCEATMVLMPSQLCWFRDNARHAHETVGFMADETFVPLRRMTVSRSWLLARCCFSRPTNLTIHAVYSLSRLPSAAPELFDAASIDHVGGPHASDRWRKTADGEALQDADACGRSRQDAKAGSESRQDAKAGRESRPDAKAGSKAQENLNTGGMAQPRDQALKSCEVDVNVKKVLHAPVAGDQLTRYYEAVLGARQVPQQQPLSRSLFRQLGRKEKKEQPNEERAVKLTCNTEPPYPRSVCTREWPLDDEVNRRLRCAWLVMGAFFSAGLMVLMRLLLVAALQQRRNVGVRSNSFTYDVPTYAIESAAEYWRRVLRLLLRTYATSLLLQDGLKVLVLTLQTACRMRRRAIKGTTNQLVRMAFTWVLVLLAG